MRRGAYLLILGVCLFPAMLFGQTDTVDVIDFFDVGGGEGTLNTAVTTAINDGTLSNKVFRLKPFGYYVLSGTINVPAGQRLTIVAPTPGTDQLTSPPMIVWTPSDIDRTYNFNAFGDIYFKNIWILYATTNQEGAGTQVGTCLEISNDSTDNKNIAVFENVIFDYANIGSGGGAVTVSANHADLNFTNCYFRNLVDNHYRYYGRPVSFRYNTSGYHIDKAVFENCTFANVGYVYMQEGGEYTDTLIFNHCTFLNSVMFTLESGWWNWLAVTNSIFVNAFMFGHSGDAESIPAGGALNIDSVGTTNFSFTVPFTDAQRHILFANNSYFTEQWLVDFMRPYDPVTNPSGGNSYSNSVVLINPDSVPRPMPMMSEKTISFFNNKTAFPYMTMQNVYDSTNPGFLIPPTNVDAIKDYLVRKWTDNSDLPAGAWAFDPHAGVTQSWPVNEQLRYSNTTLRSAGMGGFPLGDIYRWWRNVPSYYNNWKAQKDAEYTNIWNILTNGVTGVEEDRPSVPNAVELGQNYPNPFNPTTQIDFSLPQRTRVTVKVFNVLGTEVATVASGDYSAGAHVVSFDATRLAGGVYYYRLQTESTTITKKMLLIK